ncbi:ABC transporter permease [Tengunoibacter tsumagoiensis]|uniref:Transport permease protein n=1 Tax=Tengunoibacter tsumagoiensis TaxID=2014871 RepID=A0A402A907_9CHLR|nr:ABC transporter permease [Tengunoibacter tsumagoiensis]GCE15657.1 hypothetical protein KTT_55160 [Tengunoibacter tsumagoiensis]
MNTVLAIYNETYKRLLVTWDYRFNLIVQLVTVGFIFLGASFFLGGGSFDAHQLAPVLIGYIVWFYARIVIMSTSADLVGEAQAGTLEQTYMSPVPASLLLLGRMLALLISTTIIVFLVTGLLMLLLGIRFPLRWEFLPVFLLTLSGLFGFTLILSGAGLIFKQIDSLADLIQNMLLFLTGSLLPVDRFPVWLAAIAKTLPITQGIIVLRQVVIQQYSLVAAWQSGSLLWLVIHSSLYLIAGLIIFKWCEKIAKRQGTLGQY